MFCVSSDPASGWTLSGFSGNYLFPGLPGPALGIQFSQPINSIALTFATADFQEILAPSTIQLTAYDSGTGLSVGSTTAIGTYNPGPDGGSLLGATNVPPDKVLWVDAINGKDSTATRGLGGRSGAHGHRGVHAVRSSVGGGFHNSPVIGRGGRLVEPVVQWFVSHGSARHPAA